MESKIVSEISSMYNVEELAKYIGLNDTPKSWYIAYYEYILIKK